LNVTVITIFTPSLAGVVTFPNDVEKHISPFRQLVALKRVHSLAPHHAWQHSLHPCQMFDIAGTSSHSCRETTQAT
jgi:hypothetical protein